MSINKKIVAGALVIIAGIGGVSAFAMSNPTIQADFKAVQTAIASKDLGAYKTAKTQLANDKKDAEVTKINTTTQDQLNTMSDRQAKSQARMIALNNNDLAGFNSNSNKAVDQATFDKMVTNNKTRLDTMNKISNAIKNNDFNTFKSIQQNKMNEMKANHPNKKGNDKQNQKKDYKNLTDAQLQTKFDKMVADYKATGQLPAQDLGFGTKGHKGGFDEGFGDKFNNDFDF